MKCDPDRLLERDREFAELCKALSAASDGVGVVLLLAGEAGVGKTCLVESFAVSSGWRTLRSTLNESVTPSYGPITALLRAHLRGRDARPLDGSLAGHLGALMPELGAVVGACDAATFIEALSQAFVSLAKDQPTLLVLDDLQWADHATLEFLPELSRAVAGLPLLVVGVYRNDALTRTHPLRRLRTELRRVGVLCEVTVLPLTLQATAALASRLLGELPAPELAALLFERSEGIPCFVEELACALIDSGSLCQSAAGLELISGSDLPIPETLRDTVLLRLQRLSEPARDKLDIAAVGGVEVDPGHLVTIAGDEQGIDELLEHRVLDEREPGRVRFRHTLARDVIYGSIPWARRRTLHRAMADALVATDAAAEQVAAHWLACGEQRLARGALLAAAERWCGLHAYRDAMVVARRALELWPNSGQRTGEDGGLRLTTLEQYANCAQLCGCLDDAQLAWQKASEGWQGLGCHLAAAAAERRRAGVLELQGAAHSAVAARQRAADLFRRAGRPEDAASELLAAATHLRSAAHFSAALAVLAPALADARTAARRDLEARILGLEGNVLARMGDCADGVARVKAALDLALEHAHTSAAGELHQRLADSLEHGGDYRSATAAYRVGFDFCRSHAVDAIAQACMACLSAVLRQTGEWRLAVNLCREMLDDDATIAPARAVAGGVLGSIYAMRGEGRRAAPLLLEAAAISRHIELVAVELVCAWGQAIAAELATGPRTGTGAGFDNPDSMVLEHCHDLLSRWRQTEDRHHAVPALRWAASRFVAGNDSAGARASADALTTIAAATGQREALAALAHALGEIACLEGDQVHALDQFKQALDLLSDVDVPYDVAETALRAGQTAVKAGDHIAAADYLCQAQRGARQLGARPLGAAATRALAELQSVAPGRTETSLPPHGQLTRRQHQVLQLVARGLTDREIAGQLFLSPRTVEMHVANTLQRLDCRSRTEAVHVAGSCGLLGD